jgi:hypothetical protein
MKIYNTLAKECKSFKGILFYNDYNLLGKNLEGIVGAILYMSGKTTQSPLSIAKKLNITKNRRECNQLVERILEEGYLDGKNPRTIAAVTIFIIK